MPIQQVQTVKVSIINNDQSRPVYVEYPFDMKPGELLEKVVELEGIVRKTVTDELKKKAEAAEKEKAKKEKEKKPEDKKEEKVVPIPEGKEPEVKDKVPEEKPKA